MSEEHEKFYGWHLDRRVSWGHIVTTLMVAVSFTVWLLTLNGKVDLNSQHIVDIREDDARHERLAMEQMTRLEAKMDAQTKRLEGRMEAQYSEIIRRLEIIDQRMLDNQRDDIKNHR